MLPRTRRHLFVLSFVFVLLLNLHTGTRLYWRDVTAFTAMPDGTITNVQFKPASTGDWIKVVAALSIDVYAAYRICQWFRSRLGQHSFRGL
jgi:hypothetical protein